MGTRKFNRNDRVEVYRQNGEKLAEGIILGWVHDRSETFYEYLVGSLDSKRKTYFKEDQLRKVAPKTKPATTAQATLEKNTSKFKLTSFLRKVKLKNEKL